MTIRLGDLTGSLLYLVKAISDLRWLHRNIIDEPHPVIVQMLKVHKTFLIHKYYIIHASMNQEEDHPGDLANNVKYVEVVMEQVESC